MPMLFRCHKTLRRVAMDCQMLRTTKGTTADLLSWLTESSPLVVWDSEVSTSKFALLVRGIDERVTATSSARSPAESIRQGPPANSDFDKAVNTDTKRFSQ